MIILMIMNLKDFLKKKFILKIIVEYLIYNGSFSALAATSELNNILILVEDMTPSESENSTASRSSHTTLGTFAQPPRARIGRVV